MPKHLVIIAVLAFGLTHGCRQRHENGSLKSSNAGKAASGDSGQNRPDGLVACAPNIGECYHSCASYGQCEAIEAPTLCDKIFPGTGFKYACFEKDKAPAPETPSRPDY